MTAQNEMKTPRTDALVLATEVWCAKMNALPSGVLDLKSAPAGMVDHARTLETELSAALERAERLQLDLNAARSGAASYMHDMEGAQQEVSRLSAMNAMLREALEMLHDETAEYIRLNHLGPTSSQ